MMTFKRNNKRIFLFIESLQWWTRSNSNQLDEHWDQSPSAPPGKRLLGWMKSKSMPQRHPFLTFAMFNNKVSVIVADYLYLVNAVDHRHGHETDSQSVC